MKRWFWLLLLAVVLGLAGWVVSHRSAPPELPFAKVTRETLVSVLATNGKTEPFEWAPVHSERAGRISQLLIKVGQAVSAGASLAVLSGGEAQASLVSAQARLEQARADLAVLDRGGRAAEIAQIDGAIRKLQVERDAARRDAATLERLVSKNAATRSELDVAQDHIRQLDAQIAAEQARRSALVVPGDFAAARARVRDAEAAIAQAERNAALFTIRAPRSGVVYDLPVKSGDWLNEGDLVAKVGDLTKLKVIVYVDEPDLGRVRTGLPVVITWDARPGREWLGEVRQVPSQVISLGTRQVGEVATVADNPERDLPPGANINARIRAQVVENALTIPKSALRREASELGVFALDGNRLAWRKVAVGISSESRAEVLSGLKDGDSVALPAERPLRVGMEVTPAYP